MFDVMHIHKNYYSFKEETIKGRYVTFDMIHQLLKKNESKEIGTSELNVPIHSIIKGEGQKKIFIWSQMHGNESTGTKAMFDVLNFLENSDSTIVKDIKKYCTIHCIPMLNPDGAKLYTRENAKKVDLNRDAVVLKAKESNILRDHLDSFQPQFCFNLHDQRTIFGVEGTKNSAVLSFLAPSTNEDRSITTGRKETMNVIAAINDELQQLIPNQIGRYTDEFYPTATGDNFQKLGHNTILIESGHYPDDYEREETRKFTFLSILKGLHHIATQDSFLDTGSYFEIPNNIKNHYDVIHRHQNKSDKAFQYKELIQHGKFTLTLEKISNSQLKNKIGHKEIVFVD